MDHLQFDSLAKRLSTTRLSRLTALRWLVASAAALTGVGLLGAEPGAAKKKGARKIRICVCQNADAATCKGQKKEKEKAEKILRRNDCAYRGRCKSGKSGCVGIAPGPECTSHAQCGGWLCIGNVCRGGEACAIDVDCPKPLVCTTDTDRNKRCLLRDLGFGECVPRFNVVCPGGCNDVCGNADNVNPFCLAGACVVLSGSQACAACQGEDAYGICVNLVESPSPCTNIAP